MAKFEVESGIQLNYVIDDYTDPWSPADFVFMHHGIAQDLQRWHSWVPYVARDYRILRFDFRGFGGSTLPPESFTPSLQGLLEDAVKLLDHCGLDKVHFVGASTGGMVGMLFASEFPERTLSLTLVNTIPGMSRSPADLTEWTRKIDSIGVRSLFEEQIPERFNLSVVPRPLVDWYIDDWSKVNPGWLKRMLRAVSVDISEVLSRIAAPTLIIWGEHDRVLPKSTQELMRDRISKARLEVIRDHAHNVFEAAGDQGGPVLADFLKTVRRSSEVRP
jgi:3-oxoadipate enol-lactonase